MNSHACKHVRTAVFLLTLSAVPSCGEPTADCERLKQLGFAVINYKDTHARFPPAVVLDENRRKMHSWRVLVLPYVEANGFYANYDPQVAWNDPSNADLADGSRRHPEAMKFRDPTEVRTVYQPHLGKASLEDVTTDFLMVLRGDESLSSSGIPFSPPEGKEWQAPAPSDPDELIIVQVKESSVHWMEPQDIVLKSPAPEWGIPLDDVKEDILGSVLVSLDSQAICKDREATLKLLLDRKSRIDAGSPPARQ